MIVLGIVLLLVAAVVGLAAVTNNLGASHDIAGGFSVLGHTFHVSTGELALGGIVVGAVAMLGLNLLLAGLGRSAKNARSRRQEQKALRREQRDTVSERDRLAAELEERRAAEAQQAQQAQRSRAPVADARHAGPVEPYPADASRPVADEAVVSPRRGLLHRD